MRTPKLWNESEVICKGYGGHLAALASFQELNFAHNHCVEVVHDCWVGGIVINYQPNSLPLAMVGSGQIILHIEMRPSILEHLNPIAPVCPATPTIHFIYVHWSLMDQHLSLVRDATCFMLSYACLI